jgi:hypothetical protein
VPHGGLEEENWEVKDVQEYYLSYLQLQSHGKKVKNIENSHPEPQKSHLKKLTITSRGHICDFYPKYHCELNFIEQYWGVAKLRYRNTPKMFDIDQMEKNVIGCLLDDVPDLLILKYHDIFPFKSFFSFILIYYIRYANRSSRFIDAYSQGLVRTRGGMGK